MKATCWAGRGARCAIATSIATAPARRRAGRRPVWWSGSQHRSRFNDAGAVEGIEHIGCPARRRNPVAVPGGAIQQSAMAWTALCKATGSRSVLIHQEAVGVFGFQAHRSSISIRNGRVGLNDLDPRSLAGRCSCGMAVFVDEPQAGSFRDGQTNYLLTKWLPSKTI
jgi:hypothetical protein